MVEERFKLAVFIDFDNIQIGVKDTLGKEFDVSVVLEALKERGEVVAKIAYGDWPRAGDQSRQMTQHAVQMVQRNVTPRGDKNGADINLALDALEMAFTRHHIDAFAIVGGDSDFIALVEKLKQYDKRVFVVGGRAFTSNILQRNCTEFIAYENLLKSAAAGDGSRPGRAARSTRRPTAESRPLSTAFSNVERALKVLAEREVAPQLGLLKSTLLQLDSTFSERDYGAGSFLEFMQKMEREGLVRLRRTDRSYLVEPVDSEGESKADLHEADAGAPPGVPASAGVGESPPEVQPSSAPQPVVTSAEAIELLKQAVASATGKAPNRPLYLRHIRQGLRAADSHFDERQYSFRSILDLLHQAQREGWLRLKRDRNGVWRIFPGSSAPLAPTAASVAGEEPFAAGLSDRGPAEAETAAETAFAPEEAIAPEVVGAVVSPPAIEQAPPPEPAAELKVRKTRAAKSSGKSGQRRASRRKTKEPA